MCAVPEVIKGQELGFFRVGLARRAADIGQNMDREAAITHRQPPHLEPEPDIAGFEDVRAAVVFDRIPLGRIKLAGAGFQVGQDIPHL